MATFTGGRMNTAFWIGIILGALASIAAAEIADISAWAAPRIVRRAANALPDEHKERYEEEWGAELACYEGLKLVKLAKSIHIWLNARRLGKQLEPAERITLVEYLRAIRNARMLYLPQPEEFARLTREGGADESLGYKAAGSLAAANIVIFARHCEVRKTEDGELQIRFLVTRVYKVLHLWVTCRILTFLMLVAMKRQGCTYRELLGVYRDMQRFPRFF